MTQFRLIYSQVAETGSTSTHLLGSILEFRIEDTLLARTPGRGRWTIRHPSATAVATSGRSLRFRECDSGDPWRTDTARASSWYLRTCPQLCEVRPAEVPDLELIRSSDCRSGCLRLPRPASCSGRDVCNRSRVAPSDFRLRQRMGSGGEKSCLQVLRLD